MADQNAKGDATAKAPQAKAPAVDATTKAVAKEIGSAIREAMGGRPGVEYDTSTAIDGPPLDHAPRGGIYRLDEDSGWVNAWGDEVDEQGNRINDRGPVNREAAIR